MSPVRVGRRHTGRRLPIIAILGLMVVACSGPILANPPADRASPVAGTPAPLVAADPQPVLLPRDDAAHRRLTEWWYYTGHLVTDAGRQFGFEYVIFRAERGAFPVSWASHLALTDEAGRRFSYGQRSEIGPQVDRRGSAGNAAGPGFDLEINGFDPSRAAAPQGTPWTMSGSGGHDTLQAALSASEAAAAGQPASFALDLVLATEEPAVLHNRVGYIDFGEAGGSYYYSRPRMAATGSIVVDGATSSVTGTAWFDHQWGDFISVGGGGWDWFAVNLADGTDLTLSLVRDASGAYPLVYGTLVRPDGTIRHLERGDFSVDVLDRWTSPTTATDYPAAWRIRIPDETLDIELRPTIPQQELDTRPTTGVVYWEGSQQVRATRAGAPVDGEAYVELTGYNLQPASPSGH